jgi:hypothetical protein
MPEAAEELDVRLELVEMPFALRARLRAPMLEGTA